MDYKRRPPARLSDLIELAVADARRLNRNTYSPEHSEWHLAGSGPNETCQVCLAGCVIAGTLEHGPETNIGVLQLGDNIDDNAWYDALITLDHVRSGQWKSAIMELGQQADTEQREAIEAIPKPKCSEFRNWDEFNTHLESLDRCIANLREIGL